MAPNIVVSGTKVHVEDRAKLEMPKLRRKDRRTLKAIIGRIRRRSIFEVITDFKDPKIKDTLRSGGTAWYVLRSGIAAFRLKGAIIYLFDIITNLTECVFVHLEVILIRNSDVEEQYQRELQRKLTPPRYYEKMLPS